MKKYDIAIIGGGIAGTSAAYFLAKEGFSVVLFEAKEIGSGATAKTTAMITQMVDTSPSNLIKLVGQENTELVWTSSGAAIDAIEKITKDEKISCDFMRVPAYVYARNSKEFHKLEHEASVMGWLGSAPKLATEGGLPFGHHGYLELPRQAKFDADRYVKGLKKAAVRYGAKINENARVTKIEDNGTFLLATSKGDYEADRILIATYDPYKNPKPTHFKKGMYVSYCFEVDLPPKKVPEGIYWDLNNPYHYFRVDRAGKKDSMVIGGEDHRAELKISPAKNFRALKKYLDELLPDIDHTIIKRWSGPILEPSDGLPLIGMYEPRKFVATAFSGNGMTYSTITGMLMRDLLHGKPNPLENLYDPKRPLIGARLAKKGFDYAQEFFGGAAKNILS